MSERDMEKLWAAKEAEADSPAPANPPAQVTREPGTVALNLATFVVGMGLSIEEAAVKIQETFDLALAAARAEAFQHGYEAGQAVQHNACLVEETARARDEGERAGREKERANVVGWLHRVEASGLPATFRNLADVVERGDHLRRGE